MSIPLPRPAPSCPPITDAQREADKEMYRRWDATHPHIPDRRWFEFWRPDPNVALAAKWRNFRRDYPQYL